MAGRTTKKEKTIMLRLTKHYSEGIQSSSGGTSRDLTKGDVSVFRIIYIMLTFYNQDKPIKRLNTIY